MVRSFPFDRLILMLHRLSSVGAGFSSPDQQAFPPLAYVLKKKKENSYYRQAVVRVWSILIWPNSYYLASTHPHEHLHKTQG
jgi:hypothetical protein